MISPPSSSSNPTPTAPLSPTSSNVNNNSSASLLYPTIMSNSIEQSRHSYISLTDAKQSPSPSLNLRHQGGTSPSMPVDRHSSLPDITGGSGSTLSASASAPAKLLLTRTASTIETLKVWSKTTFKCTKQVISEKLGKTTRTVDKELEQHIEHLRDLKRRYESMLATIQKMAIHFSNLLTTQRMLSDTLDLQQKSGELADEFGYNAATQRLLATNGEQLLNAMNFFISTLHTLLTKTIDDTLTTIKSYENSRIEYDAYRNDYELLLASKSTSASSSSSEADEIIQRNYHQHKQRYEKLKLDVTIKLKFLDENR
ncbi:unnamed protein product, partial [Didymodactylos carnosus]